MCWSTIRRTTQWLGRDRFVLSAGHTSLTLYIQLFLSGYGLEIGDLEALRTWGSTDSRAPGIPAHPRRRDHHRAARPGPGCGRRNGDGRAPGARAAGPGGAGRGEPVRPSRLCHRLRRRHAGGHLERGQLAGRAPGAGQPDRASTTRTRSPSRTTPSVAFSEDVAARYAAYGWHVQIVDWRRQGRYTEDVDALLDAIAAARRETGQPVDDRAAAPSSAGRRRTSRTPARPTVRPSAPTRWPRPRRCSASTRSSPSPSSEPFSPTPARWLTAGPRRTRRMARPLRGVAPREPRPRGAAGRLQAQQLPDGWSSALPGFEAGTKGHRDPQGQRQGLVTRWRRVLPELWGGSADLAESNNTTMDGRTRSSRPQRQTKESARAARTGGRCTSASASTPWPRSLNGIALHGLTRAYGGTFLIFSDYMRPAVRLAALMRLPVDLRLDPRLHRRRRGRAHPPARGAPRRAASHPGPGRGPARRRQRDRICWREHPRAHRPARRLVADPAEHAGP